MTLPTMRWKCADCPVCGQPVATASHNRDLDFTIEIRHQGWTLEPCGHHPIEYPVPTPILEMP